MNRIARSSAAFALAAALGTPAAWSQPAAEIAGTVTAVASGDTFTLADGARSVEVRLADIGAPHGGEFYAPAAKALLGAMVSGKSVRVAVTGQVAPDRVFGRVHVGSLNVNLELVRRGAAWMCLEYATDTGYQPFENAAQRQSLGLWGGTTGFEALNRCRQRPPAERPVGGAR